MENRLLCGAEAVRRYDWIMRRQIASEGSGVDGVFDLAKKMYIGKC